MTSSRADVQDSLVASLETDEQSARRLADFVTESAAADDIAVSFVSIAQGRWRLTLFCRAGFGEAPIRDLVTAAGGKALAKTVTFERLAAKDWVGLSLAGLKPVAAGRFIVHGAHNRDAVPGNRIGIEIEAALAFGTGHHGTTRGCLLALDRLCRTLGRRKKVGRHPEARAKRASKGDGPDRHPSRRTYGAHLRMTGLRILDLGTGSGVLAIAAARSLRARVLATDSDAVSVAAARDNARLNRAGGPIEVVRANGLHAPAIRKCAPFDLVFANILLDPLKRFAAPLRKTVAPRGCIVLSGLLAAQANAALAAYRAFRLERRITLDGWTTLILKRGR